MTTLTLEDLLAAARCVALWQQAGADPAHIAWQVRAAAERAALFRETCKAVHPTLGDGTVAAAASALAPGLAADQASALTMRDLLPALQAVIAALMPAAAARGPKGHP